MRRDDREIRDDGLSDIPTGDVDMAAHLTLERVAFPTSTPAVRAEAIAAGRAPEAQAPLGSGLMLALRFMQARFLSVWGLLAAAALCPAQAFADFAVFSALANFVSIAALLRFEAVFFQTSEPERLGRAFRLSLAAGAAFIGLLAVAVAVSTQAGWVVGAFGALFLVSLIGRAAIRLMMAEATAEGDFKAIGDSNIVQALVQPSLMILLIWPLGATSLALFAADAAGHVVAAGYLAWRRREALLRLARFETWSGAELRQSASRWRAAPRFLLPSALLSFAFMVTPLLALPLTSNALLAAHVALAMRLLEVPTQLFAAVSVPLVMNSVRGHPGRGRQNWVRLVTLGLVVVATLLFTAVALGGLAADMLLEGTQWHGMGEVVAILALFYGGIALVTPLHEIAALSRHPRRQLATNAAALAVAGLVMIWFGALSLALLSAIGVISLARTFAHVQFAWTRFGVDAMPVSASLAR